MKKFIIIISLLFLFSESHAQCPPKHISILPAGPMYKLWGNNATYQCNGRVVNEAWAVHYPTGGRINWTVSFPFIYSSSSTYVSIEYKITVYEFPVSVLSSSNYTSLLNMYSSMTRVYPGNVIMVDAPLPSSWDIPLTLDAHLQKGYIAVIEYRSKRDRRISPWTQWKSYNTNSVQVYEDCRPSVRLAINNNTADQIELDLGNVVINGTGSNSCDGLYFVSVQQADANGNAVGPENMRWLTLSDYQQYGGPTHSIAGFNVVAFNNSFGNFSFQSGKNYRVKLAVGMPWAAKTSLVKFR